MKKLIDNKMHIFTKQKNMVWLCLVLLVVTMTGQRAFAQCVAPPVGCSNTDLKNYGFNSTNNAATIEYDNFISGYHQTMVRTSDGSFKVWGEGIGNGGASPLSPQTLNSTNYPGLTGTPLKVAMGGNYLTQHVVLTTTGLFSWGGTPGALLDVAIVSNSVFQSIPVNGKADGLPAGVSPGDVKMLYGTYKTLVITTCSGNVWVLSANASARGNGGTGSATVWSKVETSPGVSLSNVVAARGGYQGLMALKSDGTMWTWGSQSISGDGSGFTDRTRAVQMTLPAGITPKMFGASSSSATQDLTTTSSELTCYVLATNGNLYSIGSNYAGALGDLSGVGASAVWTQPRYTTAGNPVMNNVKWLSPNEHDCNRYGVNVIDNNGSIVGWALQGSQVGGGSNPALPAGIAATDVILAVESGGHTTMVVKQCSPNFGYVGHRINGSMGDGTATNATEVTYTFTTAPVQICGAETANISISQAPTGPTGKYCVGSVIPITAVKAGGILSATGPGTLSGNTLTVTGAGTITLVYNLTSVCGTALVATLDVATEVCCQAGSTAPTLSATTKANVCPATTVDLTSITASNLPASTTLTWHTGTPATTANKITGTAVATGTYYAAFFDATSDCYSSATTAVTATVATCPSIQLTNTCPVNTVNLLTAISPTNTPSGAVVTWHTGTPATTLNKIADPTQVAAGTYYLSFYDAGTNCYSPVSQAVQVTITLCTPPIASNDADNYKPNTPKTVSILTNDITGDAVVVTTVSIVGGSNPDAAGEFLTKVVAGEGTWTVNPTTGAITFTAVSGFTGSPTPIQYTVKNSVGTVSNAATVTLTAVSAGLDITAVCGSGNVALTGTPNTGTWTVKAGNPVGGTLGTTTTGVANVSFASGANGTYSYIYTVGSTSDTMSVVVSCPQPFACNGFGYLFKGFGSTSPTSLYAVDLSTGLETLVAANITAQNINGMGYNVKDGYIWGTTTYTSDTLVRVASNGTVNFFRVVGAPSANAGDVDGNGILYSRIGGNLVVKMDINPASPTYLTVLSTSPIGALPAGVTGFLDWAYNPVDGFFYAVSNGGEILKFDLTTPSTTIVANTGTVMPANAYGAVYFDNAGNFYASNNTTGDLYKIVNINTAPVALVAASGTPAGNNDGARCFNACVKPKAGPDQTNIVLGTTVTLAPELTATGAWTAQAGNPATTAFANASVANTTVTGFTAAGTYKFIWSVLGGCADTMQVVVIQLPIASNDADNYKPNTPKTINVLTNDITGSTVVATTVSIVGGSNPDAAGEFLTKVVAGEGTWTVNPTTGAITFTAVSGFTGNPTPIQYTVKNAQGNISNAATVTLTAVSAGLDITAVCGSGNVALTGTPNTGTWTVKAGNPVGGTLSTTTTGVANVSFASGANGTYSYIYTVGSTSDTMSVVVSCPQPFACNGFGYLFKGASSTTPTSMYAVDLSTGIETLVSANITAQNINGMGYNVKDGYIWGTPAYTTDTLVRLASDGTVNFFRVVGAPPAFVGDVDANGILYSKSGLDVIKIDVNPASPTYLTVVGSTTMADLGGAAIADWAFNPIDGFLYTINNNGEILKINLTTPSNTVVAYTGTTIPVNNYGAVYFDNAGNFYASNNATGDLYKIVNLTTAPVALVAASGTPASSNDGARCFNACVKPKAGPDQTNIALGTTVTLAPELTATGAWTAQAGNPATTAFANASVANTTVTGFTAVGTYKFIWSVLGGCADTMQVVVIRLPVATNDVDTYTAGVAKTVAVLTNDITGGAIVPSTVEIGGSDAGSNGKTKTVAGEGVWTVNAVTGVIIFTPAPGYVGNPTPIAYTGKDALGNVSNAATVTLTANCPVITALAANKVNPTTCGGNNGSIKICGLVANSSGYTITYDKNGTPATAVSSQTADASGCIIIAGLTSGTYTNIKVTNASCVGGSNTVGPIALSDPATATITLGTTQNPTACGLGDGIIQISGLTSGTLYTLNYNLNGSAQTPIVFTATGATYTMSGLVAGNYTGITVTSNACISNALTKVLSDPITATISLGTKSDPTACSANDGSFTISGLAPSTQYVLNYTKDGMPQTPISFTSSGVSYMVSGLTRGTYTNIRVTNSNCTSNSISTSLNDPSAAVISAGVPTQPSACGATNGSITISGLVPGNTYIIKYKKNGIWQSQISYAATSTSYTINGLSAGSYTNITVTNGGCTSNALSQTLTDPGAATLALGTITQPNPCGANNGSIVITGLTNGLSYTLNYVKDGVPQTSATFTASSTSYTLSGLTVGLYTGINVTQATCTSNTLNASLTNPSGLNIDVVGVSPLTCSPGNEGSLLITGLSQGISYTISYKKDGAVQTPITFTSTSTSYKINGLTAGSYTEIIATQATCASNVMSETLSSPALLSTPVLSSNTLANICPALTADLTDITASNTPAGTTLSWHSGTPATAINKIADPTSVLSGTYYAAFYNATTNCYGNTSPVTATVASCSPVANPDASTAVAGTPTTILILTNDKNADGTPVTGLTKITTPVVSTLPTKGTATVNPDGTIKYTLNAGTSGTDTFIYTICDKVNTTSCDTAKVTVTITPSPVANPDASTSTAGFPTTIPILTNDKNPDGTPVTDLTKITTPVVSTLPTKGTVSVNPDGSIKYTPNPGTGGTDTFIYTICDKVNTTICDTAKVTVTITPAPVANPDGIVSTTAGFPSTIPVLTNDKNPDGTPVTDLTKITTPVVSTLPTKGTVSVNPDGTIKYTPNAGTSGTDTFIYTICDKVNTTVCDTAKVTVSITPAPVANPDGIVSTTAGFPSTIPVLTNDKNPDGTPVTDLTKITTPVVSTLPTKGTVSVNPDGTIKYTPNAGTGGTDTFIYTICDKVNTTVCDTAKVTVTITPAPVANPDGIVSTTAGFPSTIPVLTNDKNPDGTPVTDLTKITTPVVSTLPTKGTTSVNPDGTIKYTPNPGTSGTDTFIYTICDKVNTTVCDTAKVTISITPSPVANPDQPAAVAGLPTKIPVLANDKNPDGTPVTDLTKITTPVVSTLPTKGTATVNPDGTINYTPNIGTSGTDTFIYTICDKVNTPVCDTAKVTVTITPAPVANPDQPTAIAGTPTTIPILTNDKNPDGTPVTDLTKITTPVVSTLPTKGTISVNPDGSVKYTPNPGTSGPDTFIYTICDKVNTIICDTAKVTVTIIPSPVANPDGIVSTTAGLPTTIPVLTNDKNPDGTPVTDLTKITTPVVSTLPTKGTVSVNPDGTIKYTPNAGTSGTDTFIYTICDKVNVTVCDTAKVTVTITPAPVANPDPSSAIAGTPTTIPVLTNDKNPDGTPVTDLTKITTPVVSTLPTKGTTSVNPDGTIKYTPNVGTSGTDTFIYTICDKVNTTVCDTAKVTVTITPAPVANPDQPTAIAGTPTTIPVLTNDKNPDGTPVTDLTKVTLPTVPTTGTGSPTKGRVTVNPDGTIKYTPNPGTSGTDTFIYGICDKTNPAICDTAKVTVTIIPAPIANPDGVITTVAGISSTIPVLINDKNPDSTPVTDLTKISTPVVTSPPTKGLVSVNPDGTISYSPNPASSGTDSFIYTICDKTNPLVCDTAKVSINILPTPIANPDASSVIAGLPTTIPVLTNDKNPDGTPVTDLTKITTPVVSTLPTKGTTTVNPDGTIKYTPNAGTSGTDTFIYTICDKVNTTVCDTGKVTVTITPAPVANPDGIVSTTAGLPTTIPVLTNDKNPDGTPVTDLTKITTPVVSTLPTKGTTSVNPDGTIKYTPNAGTSGTDTFIYTICDKVNTTVCDTAKVTVTITPAPVANPDQPTAIAGLPTTIPVLTNDKNPDGTPVTDLTKVTLPTVPTTGTGSPTKGTVTVNPDGTIKYTSNPGTSGTDTFIYGICDKTNPAICDTAKVTVTITPAPVANPDGVITTIAGISSKIPVLTNDKNPDGTPVTDLTKISTPVVTTPPTKGLVSVNPDGTINYSPNPASSGTDTFIYTICDKTNPLVCDTAKVSINILPTPIANPDASSVTAGLPTTIPVLTNDKNPDGTPVTDLTKITTPVVSTLPTKGTTTVNPDGTIKYTPNPGTSGMDTFIYTICDKVNTTVCDTAKVTVTITPAPVANPDQPTAIAGTPTTIPVLTNDKNPDGTPVTDLTKITIPVVSTLPTKGTTSVNPDGTIKYTPNPGTSGTDKFTYTICDKVNTTVCDTAKVTVTITPTPVANPDQPTAVAGLPTSIPVLANDKNPDGTPVIDLTKITTPVVSTLPTKGTTSVNPDGTIKYTPNVGTSGTDTFIYTICDKVNTTVCDTAKVTVTITPAPVANPDQPTVIAGIPTTIPVLTNDKNPDGTPVTDLTKITTPVVSTLPTKGTISVNPDGSIKYTPNPGTSGTDTFTYTICDKVNTTVCDTAKVTVTITPAPVANPDQPTAIAGTPTTIPVLTNDKNPDGTPVTDLTKITTPVVSTLPTKGTTSVNLDGSIKYTPNPGTSGTDTFTYTICDKVNTTVCDTAKVTVTITPAPVANPDQTTAVAGTPTTIPVLTNDKNPDGTPVNDLTKLTLPTVPTTGTGSPTKGTVTVNPDGTIKYTPNVGTSGTDTFIYGICDKTNPAICDTAKVTVTITPPTSVLNPDFNVTQLGVPVTGNVNTNDASVPVGTTYGTPIPSPSNPSACAPIMASNGSYSFVCSTPGVYNYNVPVCPPGVTVNCPLVPLEITVTNVNTPNTNGPIANPDFASTPINVPVTLKTLANDASGNPSAALNPSSVSVTIAPKNGTTSVDPLTGNITYTPNTGFVGNDTLTYKVCDNASPVKCGTAIQVLTVLPVASPNTTVAVDDFNTTTINTPQTGNVSTNDSDPQGQPQTVTPQTTTSAGKGTLVLNSNGSYTFTPATGYTGPVDFPYTTCDNGTPQACANATLHILINPALVAKLNLKVLLQGALLPSSSNSGIITTGLMRDDLRTAGVIPTTEPYTTIGSTNSRFTHVGGGGETTSSAVLSTSGNDAIVDWVFVELRDANNPSTVIKTKSALVQRDGDVVEASDGISAVTFAGAIGQNYYVSVKHRNHLGAMTATAIPMTVVGTTVDFTSMTANQMYNNATQYDGFEQVDVNGKMALWGGNTNADNKVKYVGVSNDQIPVFSQVLGYAGNTTQQYNYDFASPVYLSGDVNMDAKVKYRGPNNDPTFIFFNVITKYATLNAASLYNYDLFIEQLP